MRLLTLEWTKAQPGVTRFIRSLILNREDAQDVLQEVALAVVDNFESYDPERPFEGWAIGIARNQLRAHLRKVYRDREVALDESVDRVADAFQRIEPEIGDRREALNECLRRITGTSRKILNLHYVDGLKPAAIGGEISKSANHVSVMLHRTRSILRKCVEKKLNREASA